MVQHRARPELRGADQTEAIDAFLQRHPGFQRLSRRDQANVVATLQILVLDPTSTRGTQSTQHQDLQKQDSVYFLLSGELGLSQDQACRPDALLYPSDIAQVTVKAPSRLLVLPRTFFDDLCRHDLDFLKACLIGRGGASAPRTSGAHAASTQNVTDLPPRDAGARTAPPRAESARDHFRALCGFLGSTALALCTYGVMQAWLVDMQLTLFLTILSATIGLWAFDFLPNFVPALFFLAATLITGVLPINVALKGFTSNGFMLLLAVYALGASVHLSGLGNRLLLTLVSRLKSFRSVNFGLFIFGALLTPLLPSAPARAEVIAPFFDASQRTLSIDHQSPAALRSAANAFFGITLFSSVFLSGSVYNYLVLALLPETEQVQYNWIVWFKASALYGLIVLGGFLLVTYDRQHITAQRVRDAALLRYQRRLLGPMQAEEIVTLVSFAVFIIGILLVPMHQIALAWIAVFCLLTLLLFHVMTPERFRTHIDWSFLMMMTIGLGLADALTYLNIDGHLRAFYLRLTADIPLGPEAFLATTLVIALVAARLLPSVPAIVLVASMLIPLADLHGCHPFAVGFTILVANEMWSARHRLSTYTVFTAYLKSHHGLLYDEAQFFRLQKRLNLVRLFGAAGSFMYWKQIGLF